MQKNWYISNPDRVKIQDLVQALGISPLLAHLLVNRQIEEPCKVQSFLNPKLSNLLSPFLFKDMEKVISRIKKAISRRERILIYGDYDVDGISGVAILIRALRALEGEVFYYIPHRIEEGYGISKEGIKYARDKKISLMITVDCGTSNPEEIEELKRNGIDVIITDHHEPDPADLAKAAFAVLNPFSPAETYPERNLSGVGVAFKLAEAILEAPELVYDQLDLVALGTVADISPLRGENRVFVKVGLERLISSSKPGLKALLEVCGIKKKNLSTHDVGFILGPRINAIGRLESAELALRLFLTSSLSEAMEIARVLDITNRKRQEIENGILIEALNRIEREINFKDEKVIIISDASWHQGVLGIVASKLANQYQRPVFLFTSKERLARGSARTTLDNINLYQIVNKCRDLLHSFGGHRAACGIEIKEELLPRFRYRLNQIVKEQIAEGNFSPTIKIDLELSLSEIDFLLLEELDKLAPYGAGNPSPLFLTTKLRLKQSPSLANNKNPVWITDGERTYQLRGERIQSCASLLSSSSLIDLVYGIGSFQKEGEPMIYLGVEDFRIASGR